jgi:hypothetical protein
MFTIKEKAGFSTCQTETRARKKRQPVIAAPQQLKTDLAISFQPQL